MASFVVGDCSSGLDTSIAVFNNVLGVKACLKVVVKVTQIDEMGRSLRGEPINSLKCE